MQDFLHKDRIIPENCECWSMAGPPPPTLPTLPPPEIRVNKALLRETNVGPAITVLPFVFAHFLQLRGKMTARAKMMIQAIKMHKHTAMVTVVSTLQWCRESNSESETAQIQGLELDEFCNIFYQPTNQNERKVSIFQVLTILIFYFFFRPPTTLLAETG